MGTINRAAGTSVILNVGGDLGVDDVYLADEVFWYVGCGSEMGVSEIVGLLDFHIGWICFI